MKSIALAAMTLFAVATICHADEQSYSTADLKVLSSVTQMPTVAQEWTAPLQTMKDFFDGHMPKAGCQYALEVVDVTPASAYKGGLTVDMNFVPIGKCAEPKR